MTNADDKKPFNNPFGALGGVRGVPAPPGSTSAVGGVTLPDKKRPAAAREAPPPSAATSGKSKAGRFVVRLERSGRGGKEVTVIDRLPMAPAEREKLLKALKSALGCGGSLEGDALVLQGDQRERLEGVRPVFHSFGL